MIWICNVQFVSDESHMRVALIPLKQLLSLMEASCQKNWLSGYKMKNAVNLASAPRALPTPDTDRLIIFFRRIRIDPTKSLRQVLQRHTE